MGIISNYEYPKSSIVKYHRFLVSPSLFVRVNVYALPSPLHALILFPLFSQTNKQLIHSNAKPTLHIIEALNLLHDTPYVHAHNQRMCILPFSILGTSYLSFWCKLHTFCMVFKALVVLHLSNDFTHGTGWVTWPLFIIKCYEMLRRSIFSGQYQQYHSLTSTILQLL